MVASVATVGCAMMAGTNGPQHAYPGSITTGSTYASVDTVSTQYQFERKDFDILGDVSVFVESESLLGWMQSGDAGYGLLYKKAREKMNADDVINVRIDNEKNNFFVFTSNVKTHMHGTAIKWK